MVLVLVLLVDHPLTTLQPFVPVAQMSVQVLVLVLGLGLVLGQVLVAEVVDLQLLVNPQPLAPLYQEQLEWLQHTGVQ